MEVSSERDARGREKEGRRERCGGRERGRERDAGVGIHLPDTYVCFSSSLASPSHRRSTLPTPSALYSIIPLTLARAARAWRFTLNAGPLPPVPQRRARVLPRGDRRRRRKLWEKGEGWREREREETCVPPPLALSLVFSRDRQRRRSSENTRIRNATAGQYAPTFRATKKRFPRSLPFDREPLAFVHAFVPSFPGYLPNFRIFRLALSLSLSLISFANFLADLAG